MTITAESLRELHHIHQQLAELETRFEQGPKRISAAQANQARCEQDLEKATAAYKRIRMDGDERELQLKQRENRILDTKAKLNSCSTNKEYQVLLDQVAADEQANSVLSDEILELLDKAAEKQTACDEMKAAIVKAGAEVNRVRSKVDSERDGLETEIKKLHEELNQAEQALPADVRPNYQRLVKVHGAEALAPLDGECCGGCFQRVTPQMIDQLKCSKLIFCLSCGRLLYVCESEG